MENFFDFMPSFCLVEVFFLVWLHCWGVEAVGGLPAFVGLVPCTREPWKCSDLHVLSVLGLELGTQCLIAQHPNTLSYTHPTTFLI